MPVKPRRYFLLLGLRFLAVLAACLKFFAVGAPGSPGLRIFSPEPALIRRRLAAMLAYKPRFLAGMAKNLGIYSVALTSFCCPSFCPWAFSCHRVRNAQAWRKMQRYTQSKRL